MVLYANNNSTSTKGKFEKWDMIITGKIAFSVGDGVAMWVEFRITQKGIQPIDEFLRLDMLQLFGHRMHFIPRKLKLFNQKSFPKAMFPNE